MKEYLEREISTIVDGKLSSDQIKDLSGFFKQVLSNNMEQDEESFFKDLTYDLTGDLKDLALLIIDFKKDIQSKIAPDITDLATKHIPQATDQLECVIATTETAANKIMDNLDTMQGYAEKIEAVFTSLKDGVIRLPGSLPEYCSSRTIETLSPLINFMDSNIQNYMFLISDSFVHMSFQDLTGQRIKRIMNLVGQMEAKLMEMIIAFGIRVTEKEKNPGISPETLQRTIEAKVTELAGPQRDGQGLDQEGIDELLANL